MQERKLVQNPSVKKIEILTIFSGGSIPVVAIFEASTVLLKVTLRSGKVLPCLTSFSQVTLQGRSNRVSLNYSTCLNLNTLHLRARRSQSLSSMVLLVK